MTIREMSVKDWRKAWTEIAIAYETEHVDRTEKQDLLSCSGLCIALARYDIANTCSTLRQFHPSVYWYPTYYGECWTREHDLLRATHAAFFAAMTPKEFLEIIGE